MKVPLPDQQPALSCALSALVVLLTVCWCLVPLFVATAAPSSGTKHAFTAAMFLIHFYIRNLFWD
jgi:hypothetical protein